MGTLSNYFPMGLGTSRFPIKDKDDSEGITQAAQLVLNALDIGVRYIDTSYPYSNSAAHAALRLAFKQTTSPFAVTAKVLYQHDKTSDEARRRIESQLISLGIERATFLVCWCIPNYAQFMEIMRPGGVYDGAVKLKNEGIIKHICCSLHASAEDSIKIIESGVFEATTISFNLAKAVQTIPVLDTAHRCGVDVAIMNPLGGGGIPRNSDFFSFAQAQGENTVTAALRFAKSHPAVKVVLCGLSDENEISENLKAFAGDSPETDEARLSRVVKSVKDIEGYCVNCHYCDGCPVGIPVSKIMDRHNHLLFPNVSSQSYKRVGNDEKLKENINLFHGQTYDDNDSNWFPTTHENPCIRCGACESKCTQKLNIMDAIDDMYTRAAKCSFSVRAHRNRIEELLVNKNYKCVGLYPKDRYAVLLMRLYSEYFGEPPFEWLAFNSDPSMWGREVDGLTIHSPDEIMGLKPDVMVVTNYAYDKEIYNDLKQYTEKGIKIVRLHRETDVPWIF